MSKRVVYFMFLVMILAGLLAASTNINMVGAPSTTIYIRADGLIEPSTSLIFTADNITYSFTGDFNASIVVQRSNIVVDGKGHTIKGLGTLMYGFNLTKVSNVTIKNVIIVGFRHGIYLQWSTLNVISDNHITANNDDGVWVSYSSNNIVCRNNITENNSHGVALVSCSNNTISENNITANHDNSFYLHYSSNNTISENNIANNDEGVKLDTSSGNTISSNNIANNAYGVCLYSSSNNNTVSGNNIENSAIGVILYFSSNNNTISGNNITNNIDGVWLESSSNNTISSNNIANEHGGVLLGYSSSDNRFWHNNFIDNWVHVEDISSSTNLWDDGGEGNYWSNYTGVDLNHDGIGDTSHVINANNTDNYPLMGMFHSYDDFWVDSEYTVALVSNSTVSNFGVWISMEHPYNMIISFSVTGETGYGFCRICIPKALMNPPYTVIIDNGETLVLLYNETIFDNGSHRWIYFAYQHSEHQVEIIPEFPQFIVLPLFMMTSLLVALAYRRKKFK